MTVTRLLWGITWGCRGLEEDEEAARVEFKNRSVPGQSPWREAEQEGAADIKRESE